MCTTFRTLSFANSTQEAFSFLTHDYNFRLKTIGIYKICYESDNVQVCIWHEPLSYELYFTIGLLNKPKLEVSTDDVWMYFLPNAESSSFTSSQANLIRASLIEMAQFMRAYCGSLLNGQANIYENVLQESSKRAAEFMSKRESERLRKELDVAWQNKDYKQVIAISQNLKGRTESEQMKLEYARKKIKAD